MATYYVRKTGSDAAGGTTPATAWLTIGKALGASGMASGDTVYVGAGTYREAVTPALTNPTAETKVIADIDGSHTGDAGKVLWTAYTTNDTTAPSASPCLTVNTRNFLTFQGFAFVGGSASPGSCVLAAATSTNITFRKCSFWSTTSSPISIAWGIATPLHWLIEKCVVFSGNIVIDSSGSGSTTADWDLDVIVRNCLLVGSGQPILRSRNLGAQAFHPGGLRVHYCTLVNGSTGVSTSVFSTSAFPSDVRNCAIMNCSTAAISASVSGEIVEDYNVLQGAAVRTNVTAGTHSAGAAGVGSTYAAALTLGQEFWWGDPIRPFGTPVKGSPLLGFGADPALSAITDDLYGNTRPTPAAVGCLERPTIAQRYANVAGVWVPAR